MKTILIPPSKSIAHRALICAALADGESRISPIDRSEDVEATCRCLGALGAEIRFEENGENQENSQNRENHENREDRYGTLLVGGMKTAGAALAETSSPIVEPPLSDGCPLLDCGESGSTLRFLLPLALLQDTAIRFTGSDRLMKRPLGPYLEVLRENGAKTSIVNERCIEIKGPLRAGTYTLPGDVSSQYVTGLLLALPMLPEDSEIILTSPLESRGYVDLTIGTMRAFGVSVESKGEDRFLIPGGQQYRSCRYTVESDYSNAAFFLVAGVLGYETECFGLSPESVQGDREILRILADCGAKIIPGANGGVCAVPGELRGITVDARQIPDLVPILAVLFSFCKGESRIINAGRLRLKESDRLSAVKMELEKLGVKIEEGKDSLTVQGAESLAGGRVDAHNDHRIAMALAVASLGSRGTVELTGSSCVKKSYPGFWEDFGETERLVRR